MSQKVETLGFGICMKFVERNGPFEREPFSVESKCCWHRAGRFELMESDSR